MCLCVCCYIHTLTPRHRHTCSSSQVYKNRLFFLLSSKLCSGGESLREFFISNKHQQNNSTYEENYRPQCESTCKLEVMGLIDVRIHSISLSLSPIHQLSVYVAYFSNCERRSAMSSAIFSSEILNALIQVLHFYQHFLSGLSISTF